MVVFLLICIVLILLFGAGVIRGWIRGFAVHLVGFVFAVAILLMLEETVGIFVGLSLLLGMVLLLWVVAAITLSVSEDKERARIEAAAEAERQSELEREARENPPFRAGSVRLSKEEKKRAKSEFLGR